MVTRLGLGTFGVAWSIGVPKYPLPVRAMSYTDVLQFAHELGLKLVQFGDNLPLDALSDSQLGDVLNEAQRLNIALEVGTRGISDANLSKNIALAARCQSPILRVVVDSANDHPSPDEVVMRLRPHVATLEQNNVVLAIENHDRFPVADLVHILQSLESPYVGICLDTVNSFGSLEGPAVVIAALAPYVVNLHVKEFVIKRADHNMGFTITGAPAGQGMLDMPRLLDTLNQRGRHYNAIIETWLPPLASMDDTAQQEQDWVRQSVAYLRTLIED
jgi:sugar phosphate isomerase/epimerase